MEPGRLCTNALVPAVWCSEVVRHRELAAGDGGPVPFFFPKNFSVSWTLPVSAKQRCARLVPCPLVSVAAGPAPALRLPLGRAQASVSTAWSAPEQLWVCLFLPLSQAQVPPGEKGWGLSGKDCEGGAPRTLPGHFWAPRRPGEGEAETPRPLCHGEGHRGTEEKGTSGAAGPEPRAGPL